MRYHDGQQILFHKPYPYERFIDYKPNSFCYRQDRSFKWLQKLCIWILSKIGAHQPLTETCVDYQAVDVPDIVDEVAEEMRYLKARPDLSALSDEKFHLFIGSEQLTTLQGRAENYMFTIDATGKHRFLNLPITVVPWMSGMIIMPIENRGTKIS